MNHKLIDESKIRNSIKIRPEDIRVDKFRAHGNGGQNVNKTESAVRITHYPTGIVVECQDERSQHQNKMRAIEVLKNRIAEQLINDKKKALNTRRSELVGNADRNQKIRTYDFKNHQVTDHRTKKSYRLEDILDGDLDKMMMDLIKNGKEI